MRSSVTPDVDIKTILEKPQKTEVVAATPPPPSAPILIISPVIKAEEPKDCMILDDPRLTY